MIKYLHPLSDFDTTRLSNPLHPPPHFLFLLNFTLTFLFYNKKPPPFKYFSPPAPPPPPPPLFFFLPYSFNQSLSSSSYFSLH